MNPYRFKKIAVFAVWCVCITCSNAKAQSVTTPEAQAAATKFWSSVLTQCGDSYYESVVGDYVFRYLHPYFELKSDAVTGTDKLNGYRWRGTAILRGKSYKTWSEKYGWSEWEEAGKVWKGGFDKGNHGYYVNDMFLEVEMWNLGGHWHFRRRPLDGAAYEFVDEPSTAKYTLDLDTPTQIPIYVPKPYGEAGDPSIAYIPIKKLACSQIPGTK